MNPLISIIIPTYNVEKYIERCLNSIFNQTFQNYEVIIIDDVSKDNTVKVIKKKIYHNPKARLLELSENHGPAYVREKGLELVSGDIITFVDSDDWYNDNRLLETIITTFRNHDVDCVMYGYRTIHGHRIVKKKRVKCKSGEYNAGEAAIRKVISNSPCWHYLWNKAYKKSFIKDNNIHFDVCLRSAEDVHFNEDVMKNGARYYVLDRYFPYDYNCTNTNQITRIIKTSDSPDIEKDFENIKKNYENQINIYNSINVLDKIYYSLNKEFYRKIWELKKRTSKNSIIIDKINNDLLYIECIQSLGIKKYVLIADCKIDGERKKIKQLVKKIFKM